MRVFPDVPMTVAALEGGMNRSGVYFREHCEFAERQSRRIPVREIGHAMALQADAGRAFREIEGIRGKLKRFSSGGEEEKSNGEGEEGACNHVLFLILMDRMNEKVRKYDASH